MKSTYVTWHYTTHGTAYFKHVLSSFYKHGIEGAIQRKEESQEELHKAFDTILDKGFLFDEVIYLTAPQTSFDSLSTRRFTYTKNILDDSLVKERDLQMVYKEIIDNEDILYDLDKELEYVKRKYPKKEIPFKETRWRNIQHYPVVEQIKWLTEFSNFKRVYQEQFNVVELPVQDLRDEQQIAKELNRWLSQYTKGKEEEQFIINVSLGSNETQVVWHALAGAGRLPSNVKFIKTYDDKLSTPHERFKHFSIKEVPVNIIQKLSTSFSLFDLPQSIPRKLAQLKMKTFLDSGFSIMLLGERGTGKSQIAQSAQKDIHHPLVSANCASFDTDSKAEAELFGYEKGAFTGANTKGAKGLLEEAHKGVLFLDEIHHLSKLVQAKLMKALQTDERNQMSIRPLGATKETKVECQLIFASNKTVDELKDALLPDFYDRIVQHVIEIPPLRKTHEDREKDWNTVWESLKFVKHHNPPEDEKLIAWLKSLPLYGNFRDLQKIAMYYNAYQRFDDELKKMDGAKSPLEYAQREFKAYYSPKKDDGQWNFTPEKTSKQMIADYKYELGKWAIAQFGTRKKAVVHFKEIGDTVTEKTLGNWRNRQH